MWTYIWDTVHYNELLPKTYSQISTYLTGALSTLLLKPLYKCKVTFSYNRDVSLETTFGLQLYRQVPSDATNTNSLYTSNLPNREKENKLWSQTRVCGCVQYCLCVSTVLLLAVKWILIFRMTSTWRSHWECGMFWIHNWTVKCESRFPFLRKMWVWEMSMMFKSAIQNDWSIIQMYTQLYTV